MIIMIVFMGKDEKMEKMKSGFSLPLLLSTSLASEDGRETVDFYDLVFQRVEMEENRK